MKGLPFHVFFSLLITVLNYDLKNDDMWKMTMATVGLILNSYRDRERE